MKSSTARWTTACAVAACLATPTLGWSQTPPTSQPPATQQQPSTPQQPSTSKSQQAGEAQEHLRQAQSALKDIPATIPARAKSRVAELKRHLNMLEKSGGPASMPSGAAAPGAKTTARAKSNWSTEVAAIDKILTELLGPASTSGASQPTGTTGAKTGSTTAMTLDETTKSKLMEVRTHITAYAAAMSGTSGDAASASAPSAAEPAAAAAAQPTPSPSSPSPSSPASTQTDPATTASPQSAGQPPATPNPTGAEQTQEPPASSGQQVDSEASKRHLTAARESLSQLTQLPAAAQLTGEARTQVSQLISNFNELITTKENWRASYDKVAANLTALIGAEASTESAPAQAGGAVGTSGSTAASLDPAVRAKLVEFRSHLKQFEQAAGGAAQASAAASSPSTSSMAGQAAVGTTGTTSPSPEQQPAAEQPPATAGQHQAGQHASAMGQHSAVQHIEAIEAILGGRASSSPSGAGATTGNAPAGTTGATTGSVTLNQSQVKEIRMHLAELRKAVDKK